MNCPFCGTNIDAGFPHDDCTPVEDIVAELARQEDALIDWAIAAGEALSAVRPDVWPLTELLWGTELARLGAHRKAGA